MYRAAGEKEFTLVAGESAENQNIPFTFVTHLTEDRQHFLWVTSRQGFKKLDAAGNLVHHFPPANRRTMVGAMANGKPFFADQYYLYAFSAGQNKFYPLVSEPLSRLLKDGVRYVYQDKRGYQWLVTYNRLIRFNPKTKQLNDFTAAFLSTGARHFNIDCLYENDNGQLWIESYFGVYQFDNREPIFATIAPPQSTGNTTYFSTRGIAETESGQLFIGSYKGFFEYNISAQQFTEHKMRLKKGNSWVNPLVRALVRESNGNLWLATEGNGLLYFNPKTRTFSAYLDSLNPAAPAVGKGLSSTFNYSLLKAAGRLWVGGIVTCISFIRKRNRRRFIPGEEKTVYFPQNNGSAPK